MLELGRLFIISVDRALTRIKKDPRSALKSAGGIYVLYMVTAALFYTLKPDSFPPVLGAQKAVEERGFLFWASVQACSPILLAVWIAATGWFGMLLGKGKLAIRLPAALAATVIPIVFLAVYKNSGMPRWVFALCWVVLIGVMIPGFRRVAGEQWIRLTAALAGLHSVAILLLIPFSFAVAIRSAFLYHGVEFLMLFWILRVATLSVRDVLDVPTARAFTAVFLALVAQIIFVFSLYMMGVLPKEVLKALMAA